MSLTILQSPVRSQKVALVDLGYPYGKKIYMSGSVVAVTAQLMSVGHKVNVVDFNIDNKNDARVKDLFSQAEVIGASVMGSPAIPGAASFAEEVAARYKRARYVVGGQVISRLAVEQCERVFKSLATPSRTVEDSTRLFGRMPSAYEIPYQMVWELMGETRLREYLLHELTLVLSQGCRYDCDFCTADKDQLEYFRNLTAFRDDLVYLLQRAKQFGLSSVECYASSLDFFQTPKKMFNYMEAMAEAQARTEVKLKVRCLSCMNTFLAASRQRKDFADLVRKSGLWCVGFGVDGPTVEVWEEQHKGQNRMKDIVPCYDLCQDIGLRAEVLTVMGFPNKPARRLGQTVKHLSWFVEQWPNTVVRPYVARVVMPGNKGWKNRTKVTQQLTAKPARFYNLDICGLANSTTHPRWWRRWLTNLAYLYIILRYAPTGRCATSPLLPQGEPGVYGWIAKIVNRFMPHDR
jgi:hypothetical protein